MPASEDPWVPDIQRADTESTQQCRATHKQRGIYMRAHTHTQSNKNRKHTIRMSSGRLKAFLLRQRAFKALLFSPAATASSDDVEFLTEGELGCFGWMLMQTTNIWKKKKEEEEAKHASSLSPCRVLTPALVKSANFVVEPRNQEM